MTPLEAAVAATISRAAVLLDGGGLVCFPTDTVYAVACAADIAAARDRLYAAKRRDAGRPTQILSHDVGAFRPWVEMDDRALALAEEFWPGPLTLVLPATARAIAELGPVVGKGTLGVRIPDHPVALAILQAVGRPLAASSANLSGERAPTTGVEAAANFGATVDLVVDGACEIGLGSSILDLTLPQPRLLREGSISAQRLIR